LPSLGQSGPAALSGQSRAEQNAYPSTRNNARFRAFCTLKKRLEFRSPATGSPHRLHVSALSPPSCAAGGLAGGPGRIISAVAPSCSDPPATPIRWAAPPASPSRRSCYYCWGGPHPTRVPQLNRSRLRSTLKNTVGIEWAPSCVRASFLRHWPQPSIRRLAPRFGSSAIPAANARLPDSWAAVTCNFYNTNLPRNQASVRSPIWSFHFHKARPAPYHSGSNADMPGFFFRRASIAGLAHSGFYR